MSRLLKYQIIIYVTLAVFLSLMFVWNMYSDNYKNSNKSEVVYDIDGRIAVQQPITGNPYTNLVVRFFVFPFELGFPIFIIFMSALYLYKEKNYSKSLLIPGYFIIVGSVVSKIVSDMDHSGYSGLLFVIGLLSVLVIFIISSIVNAIVLKIINRRDKNILMSN